MPKQAPLGSCQLATPQLVRTGRSCSTFAVHGFPRLRPDSGLPDLATVANRSRDICTAVLIYVAHSGKRIAAASTHWGGRRRSQGGGRRNRAKGLVKLEAQRPGRAHHGLQLESYPWLARGLGSVAIRVRTEGIGQLVPSPIQVAGTPKSGPMQQLFSWRLEDCRSQPSDGAFHGVH